MTTTTSAVDSNQWYVSPTGSSINAGTIDSPWSLSYAAGGAGGRIVPGDRVLSRVGFWGGASEQGRKHGGKKKGESFVSDTIPGMNVPKYRRETCLTGKHYRNGNSRCQRIWGI